MAGDWYQIKLHEASHPGVSYQRRNRHEVVVVQYHLLQVVDRIHLDLVTAYQMSVPGTA